MALNKLEMAVRTVLRKVLADQYPHLTLPAVVYAAVLSATELERPWYEHTLQVLDRFGETDDSYPPLPGVRAKTRWEPGATVAAALPYGELPPVILGEVKLR